MSRTHESGNCSFQAPEWLCGDHRLFPQRRPLVMGIINLTPDSFYAASRPHGTAGALKQALDMAAAGADLLDLGAESSRPGSDPISAGEEENRLLPALKAIRSELNLPLTVDTVRARTARLALDSGADGINDISGGEFDTEMLPLAASRGCGLILMHMLGRPKTMQLTPHYDDVVAEVGDYLHCRVNAAGAAGVRKLRICIDPGLGFAKLLKHNLLLLAGLRLLADDLPLLIGASRKSFISHLTGAAVEDRLGGSLAALAAAYTGGATVVRVHDVAASVQFLDTLAAIDASRTPAADAAETTAEADVE